VYAIVQHEPRLTTRGCSSQENFGGPSRQLAGTFKTWAPRQTRGSVGYLLYCANTQASVSYMRQMLEMQPRSLSPTASCNGASVGDSLTETAWGGQDVQMSGEVTCIAHSASLCAAGYQMYELYRLQQECHREAGTEAQASQLYVS
jgi:hypothetical protein